MATQHRCIHGVTPRCTRGAGRPKRQKCAGCGGGFVVIEGVYGVFLWRGDGRYPITEAISTHEREAAAEREIKKDDRLVVRFVTA